MSETLNRAGKHWQTRMWTGIVAVLLGLLAFLAPTVLPDLIMIFSGLFLIVIGGILITEVLFMKHEGISKKAYGGLGLLAILVGILAIAVPVLFVTATAIFLGAFLIVFGGIEFTLGLSVDIDPGIRILEILSGFVAMAAGVFFVILPLLSIDASGYILGLFLVVFGLIRVFHAHRMKCLYGHTGAAPKKS